MRLVAIAMLACAARMIDCSRYEQALTGVMAMAPARKRHWQRFPTALWLAVCLLVCALPLPASLQAAAPTLSFVEAPGSPLATSGVTDNFLLADVTGDSVLDIVTTGQPLQTYIGNGDGTFRPAIASTIASSGAAISGRLQRRRAARCRGTVPEHPDGRPEQR